MKIKLLLITLFVVISGCATPPISLQYSPTSELDIEGAITVGKFRYILGESEKIKPNQIRNTALSSAIFEKTSMNILKLH